MTDRRSLVQGLKDTPPIDADTIRNFVYEGREKPVEQPKAPIQVSPSVRITRVPISTRIRDDYSKALRRASLERQLEGVQPHTLQDILEQAVEPWLREHGYLP